MFPVKRAPPESDLEEFYALIGSKYISKEVDKKFDVIGAAKRKTELTKALLDRIHERSPLLVSPSVTSRPLVANAASVLDEKHLEIFEASELKAVYSLGKSVRSQQTTCCSQPGPSNKNRLYVTSNFDWFDVGYAIGELLLQRCQLEDAFFISSLLEAPLEQLRARGFPVDRIIKPEPIPEPEPVVREAPASDNAERIPAAVTGTNRQPGITEHNSSPPGVAAPSTGSTDQVGSEGPPAVSGKAGDGDGTSGPSISQDDFVRALKQMFPSVDENFIRSRLGQKATMEQVQALAEEMAMGGYPKESNDDDTSSTTGNDELNDATKPSKVLGSRKLGRAFNGLRGSNFGGATGNLGRVKHGMGGANGPGDGRQSNAPIPPEVDASGHDNMEKMLQNTVQASRNVDPNGVTAPEVNMSIPEGLDKGQTCEVIPGHDLKPFFGLNEKGETHNGIKVFSARKHPSSHSFLEGHIDAVESFAVVLERLCGVFGLSLGTVAIFHDPTGGVIAFNLNRALHFNLRFFYSLHYSKNQHNSRACYSYWFVTFCHELAHHMASGHNKEHGFYTESYVSLYLPKVIALMSQMEH